MKITARYVNYIYKKYKDNMVYIIGKKIKHNGINGNEI